MTHKAPEMQASTPELAGRCGDLVVAADWAAPVDGAHLEDSCR